MKRRLQNWAAAIIFATTIGGSAFAVATPQTTFAACGAPLLTFPAWYRGLVNGECDILSPTQVGGLGPFVFKIVLNIIDIMLQLVGYICVVYIIWGGFKYMYSAGSPDGAAKARQTILNAVIGLMISLFSVAIVNVAAGAI
jgi:hypothetical protein